MTKQQFKKKWYYKPLLVSYWGSLALLCIVLILLGYFESDVEISGFVWSAILSLVFFVVKKLFYFFVIA